MLYTCKPLTAPIHPPAGIGHPQLLHFRSSLFSVGQLTRRSWIQRNFSRLYSVTDTHITWSSPRPFPRPLHWLQLWCTLQAFRSWQRLNWPSCLTPIHGSIEFDLPWFKMLIKDISWQVSSYMCCHHLIHRLILKPSLPECANNKMTSLLPSIK